MFGHVNKRLRGQQQIQLPATAVLDVFLQHPGKALVQNFALIYLNMAIDRAPFAQRIHHIPKLLSCIATRPPLQQNPLLQMAMKCLEYYAGQGEHL